MRAARVLTVAVALVASGCHSPDRQSSATPEVRARRRYDELVAKGAAADYESVLADSRQRDDQDSSRADSPLTYDESYTVIDTSTLSLDEVVQRIVDAVG
jgi:cytidylate kinase